MAESKISKDFDQNKPLNDATLGDYEEVLHGKKQLPVFRLMLSEFLDTPYSEIFKITEMVPSYRVNLMRYALLKVFTPAEIVRSGNFDRWGAQDMCPPEYVIFSTGDEEIEGLDEGVMFLKREADGHKFVLSFSPVFGGSVLTLYGTNKGQLSGVVKELNEFIHENNFLKGKKLTAWGDFLKINDYTWDDIIVPSKIRKDICTFTVDYIKKMPELREKGLPVKRGILLLGPPGNGKTLIGKILACSVPCTFIWVPSRDEAGSYQHVFKMARDLAPSIVFMEDIASQGGLDRRIVVGSDLSGLLNMLDGIEENSYVITVATENYPELLDRALRSRPGRFDVKLYLPNPGYDQRESLLRHYLPDLDFERIKAMASKTENYSCAHLRELAARVVIQSDGLESDIEIVNDISQTFEIDEQEEVRKSFELGTQREKDRKRKKKGSTYKQIEEGAHTHPHDANGRHTHADLPEGGGHDHEASFGRHNHREDDPLEGGHPNSGSGRHRHLSAQGLEEIMNKIVDAHFPIHKWVPGFKQAWIRHEGTEEFRTTTRNDWMDHARFSLHSAGCSPDDHWLTFNNEDTRLLEIRYELEDGTVFTPGPDDWKKECDWFTKNLPEVEKALSMEDE